MDLQSLLRAAREVENSNSTEYREIVEAIKNDHILAAKETIKSEDLREWFVGKVQIECDSLMKILQSAHHLEEVSIKAVEKIISKGEKLSCLFMTALLEDHGVRAQYIDLSTAMKLDTATDLDDAALTQIANIFAEEIRNCGDKVPVVTGYFGNIPGGLLSSIGRGYTDLCAALIAVGLRAHELQIWKEVDGIYTADPRKVPTARLLSSVTPSEAAELTFYGSEVIHPFTMECVMKAKIPIRIKNVKNTRAKGTTIVPTNTEDVTAIENTNQLNITKKLESLEKTTDNIAKRPKRPTAVTIKHDIILLNVRSNKRTRAHGFLMGIFSALDRWHLSVDLISSSEVLVSMALQSDSSRQFNAGDHEKLVLQTELRGAIDDLKRFGNVDLMPGMAIVSLVGMELKNMIGISGKFFTVLGDNNINIEMISQGTQSTCFITIIF